MEECSWCNLNEEDRQYLLFDSDYWFVFLADEQDYIGRSILVLKRHCGSLIELTENEWKELRYLIKQLETCLKITLGADLCNWSCLMNSFFKDSVPNPHVHIHARPRYRNSLVINGNIYNDNEFGHHYALKKKEQIKEQDRKMVYQIMASWLNSQIK